MKIKTIVLSLNDTDNLDNLLQTCAALAVRHDAHVVGAYIIPSIEIYSSFGGVAMAEVVDEQRKSFLSMAKEVKEKFEHFVSLNNLSAEWKKLDSSGSSISRVFIEESRLADIAMIPQVDTNTYCGVEPGFAEDIIMDAGRPVIIVPRGRSYNAIGDKVVFGWNGSREAARATFDALPFLTNKSDVNLIWVDPQKQSAQAGNVPGAALAPVLARHDVHVTVEPMPTADADAGAALLTRVNDMGADLLVMGAYGHSRMREFVFGGVTAHVMKNMTVPVLMSR